MSWSDTDKNRLRRENETLRQELNEALRVAVEFRKERDAARKVADAAVRYFEDHGGNFNLLAKTFCALDVAVREYRALTESQEVKNADTE